MIGLPGLLNLHGGVPICWLGDGFSAWFPAFILVESLGSQLMVTTQMVAQLVQSGEGSVVAQPTWETRPNLGIDVAGQGTQSGELRAADARERGVRGIQGMLFQSLLILRDEWAVSADVVEEIHLAVDRGCGNGRVCLVEILLPERPAVTHPVRRGVKLGRAACTGGYFLSSTDSRWCLNTRGANV